MSTTVTTPNELEIRVERIFDAPRTHVYSVWTDPKLIPEWWGPPPDTPPSPPPPPLLPPPPPPPRQSITSPPHPPPPNHPIQTTKPPLD